MRRLIFVALAAILCILLGSPARAQRLDGSLRVTVTDKSQASVEDAKVSVTNSATGVISQTTASSSGTYVFSQPAGGYIHRKRGEGRIQESH